MNKYLFLILFLIFGLGLHVHQKIKSSLALDPVYVSIPTAPKGLKPVKTAVKKPISVEKIVQRLPLIKSTKRVVKKTAFRDIETLDFAPKVVSVRKPKSKKEKLDFIFIKKEVVKIDSKINKNFTVKVKEINKKDISKTNYELSFKKINEQRYKVDRPLESVVFLEVDPFKYKSKNIAKTEIKEDRISTGKSAIEKSPSVKKIKKQKTSTDEIVFYDYSTPKVQKAIVNEVKQKEVVTAERIPEVKSLPVVALPSVTAQPVLKPETKKKKENVISSLAKLDNQAMKNLEESIKKLEMVEPKKSVVKVASANEQEKPSGAAKIDTTGSSFLPTPETCDFIQSVESGYSFDYSISLKSIGLSNNFNKIHNFELRFLDDMDSIYRDYGEGKIRISGDVAGDFNIRRGTIYTKNHFPLSMDIVIEDAEANITIPAFTLEKMGEITGELGISDRGAHVLFELDQTTEDIEIGVDHKYKAKIYLDKNFQVVDRASSDFYFIAFLGLDPGNTIVNYKRSNSEVVTKIIHLAGDELYYDPNFYAEFNQDTFGLFEEGLLSDCPSRLDIRSSNIKPWAHSGVFKKASLNSFEAKNVAYPMGSRKYVQLDHLTEPIFVGRWNQESIVIPTDDYISQVLKQFDVRGGECVVQLNVQRQLKDLKYSGFSASGGMNITSKVLDKDGKFYEAPSDQSKRVFFMGESQGVINIEINYLDGSKSYVQTFCSQNTYLIEQL